jgi:cyclopropane fatty-acyl-phospholipid synthase-like methyltransferase
MEPQVGHDLPQEYRSRFGEIAEYRAEVWRLLNREYFQHHISTNAIVLDLGCGWGEFINLIEAKKKLAMDLNSDAPKHLASDVEFYPLFA